MDKAIAKLDSFRKKHKRMPTYSEMMGLFGYKTKSAVHYLVSKLIERGLVGKDNKGNLIPKNLGETKMLGLVEAGFPSHSEEELIDTISLDDYLIKNPEASFILRAKGESMIDAGIMPGDLVVVERGKAPRSGDIIIAYVDGGYTMKYFRQKGSQILLEPANKKFKTIIPKEDFRVDAVVTGIVRAYK